MSELKRAADHFKVGDVVVHKTMPGVRWVVDGANDHGVNVTMVRLNGVRLDAYEKLFGQHELENLSTTQCCGRPASCDRPCFASENGQYDEWDDADGWDASGWTVVNEPVFDTELNTADDDDDPFEMDADDLPDEDDETVTVEEASVAVLLNELANRLEQDGFPKLAGAVDVIRDKYKKGDDCGKAVL